MKINEFCRAKRKENGISQKELAAAIGARIATLSDFENGKSGISSKTLDQIFPLLGISLEQESRIEEI
jgi:transcriptional regulator with XRE-family HTH domain